MFSLLRVCDFFGFRVCVIPRVCDFFDSVSLSISDPSPCPEAVDFLCFPAKPCTPILNFFARSGPKIEKIDSLCPGRGLG
jgi:hypothetical protein